MLVESLLIPKRMKYPKNYADAEIIRLEKRRGKIVKKVIVKGTLAETNAIFILCEKYPLETPLEDVMKDIIIPSTREMFQALIDNGYTTVKDVLGDPMKKHTIKIKRCKNCHGHARVKITWDHTHSGYGFYSNYEIHCQSCQVMYGKSKSITEAVKQWNAHCPNEQEDTFEKVKNEWVRVDNE